jgi:flagellar basal body-associated protein FliL
MTTISTTNLSGKEKGYNMIKTKQIWLAALVILAVVTMILSSVWLSKDEDKNKPGQPASKATYDISTAAQNVAPPSPYMEPKVEAQTKEITDSPIATPALNATRIEYEGPVRGELMQ